MEMEDENGDCWKHSVVHLEDVILKLDSNTIEVEVKEIEIVGSVEEIRSDCVVSNWKREMARLEPGPRVES